MKRQALETIFALFFICGCLIAFGVGFGRLLDKQTLKLPYDHGSPVVYDNDEAIDMYTIRDGHIVANRHLEDNLTLLKQLGIVSLQ